MVDPIADNIILLSLLEFGNTLQGGRKSVRLLHQREFAECHQGRKKDRSGSRMPPYGLTTAPTLKFVETMRLLSSFGTKTIRTELTS
jgi:hypothetical protein